MNTMILSFTGGDSYNKNKQVEQIKKQEILLENSPVIHDLSSLDELEETLNNVDSSTKIIILKEDNIVKFENIIKSEYPTLKENIEVIPELFYRNKLMEADPGAVPPVKPTPPPASNSATWFIDTDEATNAATTRYVIPLVFPFKKDMFDSITNGVKSGAKLLIICDPTLGIWFPFIRQIVKYMGPSFEELFKSVGENNIPAMDKASLIAKFNTIKSTQGPNPPKPLLPISNETEILRLLDSTGSAAAPSYKIAQEIMRDVESKNVQLEQDKIDKLTKENPQIANVVIGIMANLERTNSWKPGTTLSAKNRWDEEQSTTSKIAQVLGADKDAGTAAESMRKAGLGLGLDIVQGIAKHNKEKDTIEKKQSMKGNESHAFLSHPKCEDLFGSMFDGFGPNYFEKGEVK